MLLRRPNGYRWLPSLPLGLLCGLLVVLLLAGGASRPDALGQAVVRSVAALCLMLVVLFVEKPMRRIPKAPLLLLLIAMALLICQLVPLPPDVWEALPGHAILVDAITGPQPWRPLSIQPGATLNSLASLIVPVAVFALVVATDIREDRKCLLTLLVLVAISTLIGLMQFSGVLLDNPLVNDSAGAVSGFFANRNHFALFLALGCLLAPVWAFEGGRRFSWRAPLGAGLVVVFYLLILASGSRAGVVLGIAGAAAGTFIAWPIIAQMMRRLPRWKRWLIGIGALVIVITCVALSVVADRAQSIDRLQLLLNGPEDMRTRGLPIVIEMIKHAFPAGAGFGTFDAMFRIYEPFSLLKLTYFNHAHNDFIEIVLDGGIVGALLLVAAVIWWLFTTIRIWRRRHSTDATFPKVGSASLLLILLASGFDYPARTPMFMAIVMLSAAWMVRTPKAEA